MNVIKVMGGLGNQLFQYAFGKAMMLHGIDVAFDTSFYKHEMKWPRKLILDKLNLEFKESPFLNQPTIKDHKHGFDMNLLKYENHNFDGYWQFKRYYESIKDTLQNIFLLKNNSFIINMSEEFNTIGNGDSIAIHVRRGDYLVQTWGILPLDYYFEAIKEMPEDANIFVFSDDIPWCKENFKQVYFKQKIHFVEGLEDYQDFELMRLCDHVIMANSTFSWWAAFLNLNGKVIAPKQWLGGSISTSMIYPDHWVTL